MKIFGLFLFIFTNTAMAYTGTYTRKEARLERGDACKNAKYIARWYAKELAAMSCYDENPNFECAIVSESGFFSRGFAYCHYTATVEVAPDLNKLRGDGTLDLFRTDRE
jgi:hypothetical protein